MKDKDVNAVRKKIETSIVNAEEERRKKLLLLRLQLARSGIAAYQNGRIAEAVNSYHAYLKLLEDSKNVGEGGLMPSCFDFRKDMPELMTVSGIYWDLVKIYDHAHSMQKQREFFHYMEKYIIFSKGLPFQPLCAESLRKYLNNRKPVHRSEFKNAYEIISVTKCFIATSLIDFTAPETLEILRDFRDDVLKKRPFGRKLISIYYVKAPAIAARLNHCPSLLRRMLAKLLDLVAHVVKHF